MLGKLPLVSTSFANLPIGESLEAAFYHVPPEIYRICFSIWMSPTIGVAEVFAFSSLASKPKEQDSRSRVERLSVATAQLKRRSCAEGLIGRYLRRCSGLAMSSEILPLSDRNNRCGILR